MRKLDFHRYKYERELLIDCSTIGDTKHFITDDTPFHVSFHEILVITRGRGLFRLDDREIPFRKGTVLLLPPNKWRQWARVDREIDAYFFIFEEAFITEFFSDPYFLFRFHYFYNDSMPAHVQAEGEFFTELTDNLERIRRELRDLRKDSHHLHSTLATRKGLPAGPPAEKPDPGRPMAAGVPPEFARIKKEPPNLRWPAFLRMNLPFWRAF